MQLVYENGLKGGGGAEDWSRTNLSTVCRTEYWEGGAGWAAAGLGAGPHGPSPGSAPAQVTVWIFWAYQCSVTMHGHLLHLQSRAFFDERVRISHMH